MLQSQTVHSVYSLQSVQSVVHSAQSVCTVGTVCSTVGRCSRYRRDTLGTNGADDAVAGAVGTVVILGTVVHSVHSVVHSVQSVCAVGTVCGAVGRCRRYNWYSWYIRSVEKVQSVPLYSRSPCTVGPTVHSVQYSRFVKSALCKSTETDLESFNLYDLFCLVLFQSLILSSTPFGPFVCMCEVQLEIGQLTLSGSPQLSNSTKLAQLLIDHAVIK